MNQSSQLPGMHFHVILNAFVTIMFTWLRYSHLQAYYIIAVTVKQEVIKLQNPKSKPWVEVNIAFVRTKCL